MCKYNKKLNNLYNEFNYLIINKMADKIITPVKNTVDKPRSTYNKYEKLQKILESRKKRREGWDEDKRKNYEEFLKRLKEAHDNFVEAFENKIKECSENIAKKNVNSKEFKLWDPQNIQCDLKGFKEFTIYRGFWNGEKKKHDRLPHMEAGIKATPFVELSRKLKSEGFLLKDISNASLSLHIVVQVTMTSEDEGDVDDNSTVSTKNSI